MTERQLLPWNSLYWRHFHNNLACLDYLIEFLRHSAEERRAFKLLSGYKKDVRAFIY